jgi:hypothetical protein
MHGPNQDRERRAAQVTFKDRECRGRAFALLLWCRDRYRWRQEAPLCGAHGTGQLLCWFLDAGNDETLRTLSEPASKKRQGTKSREVGHRLSSECYADLMPAPLSMVSATRARGNVQCLHTGEPKRVQWASRRARAAGELIDGYCFERRQPGRTLPQLPRFGMSVAQTLMFSTCVISNSCAWQKIARPTTTARLIGRSMSSDMV